jgi:hypothetical protein
MDNAIVSKVRWGIACNDRERSMRNDIVGHDGGPKVMVCIGINMFLVCFKRQSEP